MKILLITSSPTADAAEHVLPALDLLSHPVRTASADARSLVVGGADVILLDARTDVADAQATTRMLTATGRGCPLVAVVGESSLATLDADWALDDIILTTAGPSEVEVRLRLATQRWSAAITTGSGVIRAGDLTIHPEAYAARLDLNALNLTYREFRLLTFLAEHPGRVFTRHQLLDEVWGYAYFGGHRTVDVHVRRLRAKLGTEQEAIIGTVRRVGYKFVPEPSQASADHPSTTAGHPSRMAASSR